MNQIMQLIQMVIGISLLGALNVQAPAKVSKVRDVPERTGIFMPLVTSGTNSISAYGIESDQSWSADSVVMNRASELGVGWARVNSRVKWRDLQPNESDPINWSLLAGFENELQTLQTRGIRPVVTLQHFPHWATTTATSCGEIRADKLSKFGDFMYALVSRYKSMGVSDWEIGNEPDVDPTLVGKDWVFGCWGKISDAYYNGGKYGEMLKVATPRIRQADPGARVWLGGLLLASMHSASSNPPEGKPERFFEGILLSGAGPYFDIIGYHSYAATSIYEPVYQDHDKKHGMNGNWGSSAIVGKLNHIKQLATQYGINKPIYLNEAGLICWECDNPQIGIPANYLDQQAVHLVRIFSRALAAGASGVSWYTLEGPGWANAGILEADGSPRPAFKSYKAMVALTKGFRSVSTTSAYGNLFESYRFSTNGSSVDVIIPPDSAPRTISVPSNELLGAYDQFGSPLATYVYGTSANIQTGSNPIYIARR